VARHITAPQTPIRQQKQEEIERKRTSDFRWQPTTGDACPKEKLTNPLSKPTFSFRNNRNEHSFTLAAAPPDSVEYELAPYYFFGAREGVQYLLSKRTCN
jgi:hypothetical protein